MAFSAVISTLSPTVGACGSAESKVMMDAPVVNALIRRPRPALTPVVKNTCPPVKSAFASLTSGVTLKLVVEVDVPMVIPLYCVCDAVAV